MNAVSRVFLRDFRKLLTGHRLFRILPNGFLPVDSFALTAEVFAFQNILAVPTAELADSGLAVAKVMTPTYPLGCAAIRAAIRIPPLAHAFTSFSRIWSRHARIHAHLVAVGYDGVIDGGANIGEFAGLVRSALPHADLVCIEPHPFCARALRRQGYRVVEAAL